MRLPWKRREQWQERLGRNKTILWEKLREALASVVPITVIVLILSFTVAPIPTETLLAFLIGAVMVILGIGLFSLGADTAMTPIGERVGAAMTRSRKLWVVAAVGFLIGVIVTVSEPDLQVLAQQVPGVPNATLVGAVAVGVGVFLVIAMLRILFRIPLNRMLIVFYILVFALALFVPEDFLAIAFDSGGVTTGPMTVPFIMALGVGVASIRSDENAAQDSFGLVALCSVGPILAVMVLALIYPGAGVYTPVEIPSVTDSRALWHLFQVELPAYLSEVAVCLAPIALFFAVFQAVSLKLKKKKVLKIVIGILYTYVGLVLFLTGANVGFMPAASYLSRQIAGLSFNWILIPIGMLMGWFIVQAEPAVHVLNKQVEEITSGAGISIFWLVVPGYLAAIVMSFFVPKIFTAIAFDSGGVASGPMTATFLLPFAQGACEALGGNVVTDAFGVVAMVAMTPLLTIQMLGLLYQLKMKRAAQETPPAPVDEEIIEL